MPRPRKPARVLGPYPEAGGYRVVAHNGQGARNDRVFATEREAQIYIREMTRHSDRLNAMTIGEAIEDYEQSMRDNGLRQVTIDETIDRLMIFFPDRERSLSSVTHDDGASYYEAVKRRRRRDGRPVSADRHRNILKTARSFMSWAVKNKLLARNPLVDVCGTGKRSYGKPQLTGNEAQRWFPVALMLAEAGDHAALGCAMLLTMGLRQRDVTQRLVRDVDLNCTVLRVENGKTAKSNRPRHITSVLQPLLRRVIGNRPTSEPLFPARSKSGFHGKTWMGDAARRIADRAGTRYVCPHGLKGTAATLALEVGALADQIADFLSHESVSITERYYFAPGATEAAQQNRTEQAIGLSNRFGILAKDDPTAPKLSN